MIKTGRPMGQESLTTLNRKAFRKRMADMGRDLKLDQKIKLDLERLNDLQKMSGSVAEELDILKSKFTVYFQLMPYLLPKLQAIEIKDDTNVKKLSDEEANTKLALMLNDTISAAKLALEQK